MKSAIPFFASMALSPLCAIAALFASPPQIWLPIVSGVVALVLGLVSLAAQLVRATARWLRLFAIALALGLLAIAIVAFATMASATWLAWPTLVAGILVLVAPAFDASAPATRVRAS